MRNQSHKRESPEARFWRYVKKTDGCWEWLGSKTSGGYGQLMVKGENGFRPVRAHRFSYQLHYGKIPKGEGFHGTCILHHCDNPPCVNPKHLFPGTNRENIDDMKKKGRTADRRGEKSGRAKLTWNDVRMIREIGRNNTQSAITKIFKVDRSIISEIINNKIWKI